MKKESQWLKISELEQLSGISRRTIHFYLQKGLLPQPVKTGKTMSYYNDDHINTLKQIQELKKKGLPLAAIHEKISSIAIKEETKKPEIKGKTAKKNIIERQKLPQKDQGKRTRKKIIDLGCKLFREKGYKETSVSDITRKLNIGKGSFYFYFSDKKELLFECVPIIFKEFFSEGWEMIRKEKDPIKRFELRAQIVIPVLDEFCSILQICKEVMEDSDQKLKKLGRQTYLSIRMPLENDIRKGIQLGLIKNMDPVIVSTFMIGIIESIYYLKLIDNRLPSSTWESLSKIIKLVFLNDL